MIKAILKDIYGGDPNRAKDLKRFSFGKVISTAGGMVTVDVKARLPNGKEQYMTLPAAEGFSPSAGQTVQVNYPNGPHSGYVSNVGSSTSAAATTSDHSLDSHTGTLANTKLANPDAVFAVSMHVGAIGAGAVNTTLQSATKNKSGVALTVLGVTIFARDATGTADPTVDVYEGASSILSAPQAIAAAGTLYEPTVTDATIANGSVLSIRATTDADGSLGELEVVIWCKAAHLA